MRESVASLGLSGLRQAGAGRFEHGHQQGARRRRTRRRRRAGPRARPQGVVEAAVVGREIECGVLEALDGGRPDVSVAAEIAVLGDHEFYDFDAKYLDDEHRPR